MSPSDNEGKYEDSGDVISDVSQNIPTIDLTFRIVQFASRSREKGV
jgi:hypothetical protein